MTKKVLIVAGLMTSLGCSFLAAQTPQAKLTQEELIRLIKQSKDDLKQVASALEQRGVDFDLDEKIEKKLRKAGANDEILQDVYKASPAGLAARKAILTSATGAQLEASPEEGQGYQTMVNETDPDKRLRMVSEFEREFPNSKIMSYVYAQAARSSQEKGDASNAVSYSEKSLKLDPDNLSSLLMVATTLAQPNMVSGSDSEKSARLAEAERDADRALKLIDAIPKRAEETEEQAKKRRDELAPDAHYSLGMVALLREDPAKAAEEFKAAISLTSQPTAQYYYRLGDAYSSLGKNPEALAAFGKAAETGKGTAMEQYANRRIEEMKKSKP